MKKNFLRVVVLVILSIGALHGCGATETDPVFEQAWIRAIPPGMKMTSGYGTIRNGTGSDVVIESFSSPFFNRVSLHRTEVVDGVSKMREVESLSVAAGEAVELAPGGYHLMLMLPNHSIVPNQVVPLEMKTADGKSFSFQVPVEER